MKRHQFGRVHYLVLLSALIVLASLGAASASASPNSHTRWHRTPTTTRTVAPTATRTIVPTKTSTRPPATRTRTQTSTPPVPTGAPTQVPTRTVTSTPINTVTPTSTPTPTRTPVPTSTPISTPTKTLSPTPTPTPNTSQLLFDDEFNGSTLNSVWTNGLFWWNTNSTGAGIHEQAGYQPSQAVVSGGTLSLTAINKADAASGRPYTSGMVNTGGVSPAPAGYQFTYGYTEARIKLPAGNGMWPAFWLWNDPPEIDILENLGKQITIYYATLHNPSGGGSVQYSQSTPDLSADFHIYAVDWQPTYLDFYFDGAKFAHYDDSAHYFNKPMYIILNLAVGGDWAGPVDNSKLPATMLVDWVKVWKVKP